MEKEMNFRSEILFSFHTLIKYICQVYFGQKRETRFINRKVLVVMTYFEKMTVVELGQVVINSC
jgi:hypothetical protein